MSILDLAPGIHASIPESTYHERHLGLASKSALDLLHKSPAHYHAWATGPVVEEEENPAFVLGTALHCATLEPDRFHATYIVKPDFGDCRKTDNKARRDAWLAENGGRNVISAEDMRDVEGMLASIRKHPRAAKLLIHGAPEVTLRWQDDATGVQCKSRMDWWVERSGITFDLKSTQDASPAAFARSVANFGYHRQAAFYMDGLRQLGAAVEHFLFVAVEKTAPYPCAIYSLDELAIQTGHLSIRDDMERLADCMERKVWPGYDDGIRVLSLHSWAKE